MLNVTADSLYQEVMAGEKLRDDCLKNYKELLNHYVGDHSEGRWSENLTHEYLSHMVADIVTDNPKANVTSRRQTSDEALALVQQGLVEQIQTGQMDLQAASTILQALRNPERIADALEHAVGQWILETDYGTVLNRLCYDMLLAWGVSVKSMRSDPYDDDRRIPVSQRIAPRRFVCDPTALHYEECLWAGHWYIEPKDVLEQRLKQPQGDMPGDEIGRWRPEALKDMPEFTDDDTGRQQVKLYEIWVKDYQDDKWTQQKWWDDRLFHGALFTMAGFESDNGPSGTFIREPRPYYGPPAGPYVLFGAYLRIDQPYPLSPLLATFDQQKELNLHAESMNQSAAAYKRILLVSDKNPNLAQLIKDGKHDFVFTVDDEGFDRNQQISVEIGGVTDQQMKHFEMFNQRWERATGMDETQSGVVPDSDTTATATAIADEASRRRSGYISNRYRDGVSRDLWNTVWFMCHDERYRTKLGADASRVLGLPMPSFVGGVNENEEFDIHDLQLFVDAYSMGRTGEALLQRRFMEAFNIITSLVPLLRAHPELDGRKLLRQVGDVLNLPQLEEIIDFDTLQQMMAVDQQQQAIEMQSGGGGAAAPGGNSPSQPESRGRMMGGTQAQARTA